jgi:hypothetical protein
MLSMIVFLTGQFRAIQKCSGKVLLFLWHEFLEKFFDIQMQGVSNPKRCSIIKPKLELEAFSNNRFH